MQNSSLGEFLKRTPSLRFQFSCGLAKALGKAVAAGAPFADRAYLGVRVGFRQAAAMYRRRSEYPQAIEFLCRAVRQEPEEPADAGAEQQEDAAAAEEGALCGGSRAEIPNDHKSHS